MPNRQNPPARDGVSSPDQEPREPSETPADTGRPGTADDELPPLEIHELVNESEARRLDQFLAEHLEGHSRSYLQKLISSGCVELDPAPAKPLKASLKLAAGTRVRVKVPPPRKISLEPVALPIQFLHEDDHLAVIDKPAGLTVHPGPHLEEPTLVNALLHWIDDLSGIGGVERPGIVHRLDRETSGVLIVAKNDLAHQGLSAQFKKRTVRKTYLAVSRGEVRHSEGTLDGPIERSRSHSKKMVIAAADEGREARTDYKVKESYDGYCLIECHPHTGRTHQIRVHLASIRLPIACDKLYGREKAIYPSTLRGEKKEPGELPVMERHALHAQNIRFTHPATSKEMSFSASLPDDMGSLLKNLRKYRPRGSISGD